MHKAAPAGIARVPRVNTMSAPERNCRPPRPGRPMHAVHAALTGPWSRTAGMTPSARQSHATGACSCPISCIGASLIFSSAAAALASAMSRSSLNCSQVMSLHGRSASESKLGAQLPLSEQTHSG